MAILGVNTTYSCTINITNDTGHQVLIVAEDGSQAIHLPKNKTKKFGNNYQHARFYVFNKEKGRRVYRGLCTLRQYACTQNKRVDLKMTDIEHMNVDTSIFKIAKAGQNHDE